MSPYSKLGSVTKSYPGPQKVLALALAGYLLVGTAQAAPDDGNADVVLNTDAVGGLIGVDELPDGLIFEGSTDEINHDPITGDSQALAIDFGEPVADLSFRLGQFQFNDASTPCRERGRWTAFDETGQFLDSSIFTAADTEGGAQTIFVDPIGVRYLALNAEPYAPSAACTVEAGDSSDFSIRDFEFCSLDDFILDEEEGGFCIGYGEVLDAFVFSEGGAGATLYAYDTDEEFADESGFLPPPPNGITVGGGGDAGVICEGGFPDEETGECEVEVGDDIVTVIEEPGDAVGSFSIRETLTIVDPRTACEDPPSGSSFDLELTDEVTGIGDLLADVNTPVKVPAELCGIPNASGIPEIKIVVIDSSLEVSSSAITHIVDDPANTDFLCRAPGVIAGSGTPSPATLRGRQPVFGWLPKFSATLPEVPVLDGAGNIVTTLQDVTSGCGTYRGRTKRLSFLVYNLRYLEGTNFTPVIGADIAALRATLAQADSGACAPGPSAAALRANYAFLLQFAELYYNFGFAPFAKQNLLAFRSGLLQAGGNGPFSQSLNGCFFNHDTGMLQTVDDGPSVVPRNFRGDLLIRVEHVLYMLETMQGVLNPPS